VTSGFGLSRSSLPSGLLAGVAALLARLEADIVGGAEGRGPCSTDELAHVFYEHRDEVVAWLTRRPNSAMPSDGLAADLSSTYARRFRAALNARNQFVEIDAAFCAQLIAGIEGALGSLAESLKLATSEPELRRVLRRFIRQRYCRDRRSALALLPKVSVWNVVSGEYSPELQLSILGLRVEELLPPVIDLGSGQRGLLVLHLRRAGLAVTGLDRLSECPGTLTRDWFEQPFEPLSVGTLISHQAFSLQFLHQHFQSNPLAYRYAGKYMELLRSLKVGGRFAYAPGLPFIEALLEPEDYRVERVALPETLDKRVRDLRDLDTGESVAYCTHVVRRR
jgi:hypothetical protein